MNRFVGIAALAAAVIFAAPPSQATLITYEAILSGPAEAPPNASPGTGFASVIYDSFAQTLAISASWSGLLGTTTVAHIHCCTAAANTGAIGVAVTPGTLPGFPAGTTSGTYATLLDLTLASTFTTGFVNNFAGGLLADAEESLIAGLNDERAYFNIHTNLFPGGEIRGFLSVVSVVPAPGTLALLALGLAGLGLSRRRRT